MDFKWLWCPVKILASASKRPDIVCLSACLLLHVSVGCLNPKVMPGLRSDKPAQQQLNTTTHGPVGEEDKTEESEGRKELV